MTKEKRARIYRFLLVWAIFILNLFALNTYAAGNRFSPDQTSYEGIENEEFGLDASSKVSLFKYGEKSIGLFEVMGQDIRRTSYQGANAYVGTGSFSLLYSYDGSHQTKEDEKWNLVSSGKKKVGDITLKQAIKKGVALVQRSEDRSNWVDVTEPKTNLFEKFTVEKGLLYSVPEADLKQGVYFRVIIAYEMTQKSGTSSISDLPLVSNIPVDQFENRMFVEEYIFFVAYGQNPVIIRDLHSRNPLNNGISVEDGFIVDKNGASDIVKVTKNGGSTVTAVNNQAFCKPGIYSIDIESKIGSRYQYSITVNEGTSLQPITAKVFENQKNDNYSEINPVIGSTKTGLSSYSNLYIGQRGKAGFLQSPVNSFTGYGIDSDRVSLFMQFKNGPALVQNGWEIQPDNWGEKEKQTIGDTYTGVVGSGAIIVQTSPDGINWKDIDRERYANGLFTTDVIANYEGKGPVHIYSPDGNDILKGLFVKVIFAYRAKNRQTKEDYRYIEKYEFYLCSSNLDAVTFHNLSAKERIENLYGDYGEETVTLRKRMETMLSGAGTVTGFQIDTSLNPTVTYDIFRDGKKIIKTGSAKYTDNGRYEIQLKSRVGNQKTVILYVDQSDDQIALQNYFGDSFIIGKRIYSEGSYPVFEGGKTSYNINAVPESRLPISGKITNTTTGDVIEIKESRTGKTGLLNEAGDYVAVFSTNSKYISDKQSGDNRTFTFRFKVYPAGQAPGPKINKESLYKYAQSKVSDSYPIYYGLTFHSATKGNITLAFATKEDAVDYQRRFETGIVERQSDGSFLYTGYYIVAQKEKYDSAWDIADAVDYYANQAVTRSYFDMSDEARYLTLKDEVIGEYKNLRVLDLERSVVIFGDGQMEKLTALKDALPIINSKPYAYIMPGQEKTVQTGHEGFEFVQDKYQCDSSSVEIIDCNGKSYGIEYLKDVGDQLKNYGCPTGVITIREKTIYGDQAEYQAVYISEGDNSAKVNLACYVNGEADSTLTITKDSQETTLQTDAFSITSVVDELDPYDLILVRDPDKKLSFYAADQKITNVWSKPGDYTVKVVNRLGYSFSFVVTVKESPYITIAFDGEGSEKLSAILVERSQQNVALPTPVRYGYEFVGFVDEQGNVYKDIISSVPFGNSITLDTLWKAKQFTLIFKDADGKEISSCKADFGRETDLIIPGKDQVSGFTGWQVNGQIVENNKYRLDKEQDVVFTAIQTNNQSIENKPDNVLETDIADQEDEGNKTDKKKHGIPVGLLVVSAAIICAVIFGSNRRKMSEKKTDAANRTAENVLKQLPMKKTQVDPHITKENENLEADSDEGKDI